MTGGSKQSLIVNQALGKIAHQEKIALALGSASILAKEKDQLESFYAARDEDPNGVLIVNVNPETPINAIKQTIKELQADALQIHLNTVQEIAMPEGDRNFIWLDQIKNILDQITIPVIIKEVGFGLDQNSIHLLKEMALNSLMLQVVAAQTSLKSKMHGMITMYRILKILVCPLLFRL